MIVAIERTKFTYLYKYNQIRLDISQVIDKSVIDLKEMLQNDFNGLIQLFNIALPLFEQDHEVILLSVDKNKITVQNGILISFDSIQCIYPITKTGSQLLEGKINIDFLVKPPVFENAIEAVRINRSMEYRETASRKLLSYFNLYTLLDNKFTTAIESSVKKNLLHKTKPQQFNTFLDHLISYNKTPSFIPDGNIENICKIGAIAIKYLGKPEEVFLNGPFYKSCLNYKNKINTKSYHNSYMSFLAIPDEGFKESYKKIVQTISNDFDSIDVFQVSYFFLAFRSYLNKNENKLLNLKLEIQELKKHDERVAAFVLALIGYTFSFEQLYDSIYIMNNVPLLMTSQRHEQQDKARPIKEEPLEDSLPKAKDIYTEGDNQPIEEQMSEKDTSGLKEVIYEGEKPVLKENELEEFIPENNTELVAQEEAVVVGKNGEQANTIDYKTHYKTRTKRQPKEKLTNSKIETQVVNKPEDKSVQHNEIVKIDTTGDLFRQPNSTSIKDNNIYENNELSEIVRIVKEANIIAEKNHLKTFEEALMNYSPKGGRKDQLLKEIEILQRDLALSNEVTDKLKSIIIQLKN